MQVTTPDTIEWLNVLLYGAPGAGKTHLSGTAQDHKMTAPVLLLDVEGGTVTLRNRPDIDVIQVRSTRQVAEIHKSLYEENNGYYRTVVVDSLTELQKLDMRDIMREVVQKRPDLDEDVPSMREWGKSGEHMRRIVRAFRDLPMNTIFTALVQLQQDEIGTVSFQPSLPGKLRTEIPGFLDIVGYLYTEPNGDKLERVLQFASTKKVVAKDRTSSLGDRLENPTIPVMWAMIHNEKGEAKK